MGIMIVRAAVIQAASAAFQTQASLEKLASWAERAEAAGARVAVFPEAFLGGYPRGFGFGAVVGDRTAEGREWYRRYWESAVEVPGPAVTEVERVARERALFLVVGVIERDGGTLYCTAVFVSPELGFIGKHRKLMPTASERLIWGQGDGSTMGVFATPFGRIGAAICWENYMPLYRTHLYSRGIQLYCAPTADPRDSWQATIRHIALEGRCFVLSANQFARRGDYPADFPTSFGNDPATVMCRGGSAIVDPLGRVLAGPDFEGEALLVADLDLDEIVRGKFDFDVTGHYARPDVFRLIVTRDQ